MKRPETVEELAEEIYECDATIAEAQDYKVCKWVEASQTTQEVYKIKARNYIDRGEYLPGKGYKVEFE